MKSSSNSLLLGLILAILCVMTVTISINMSSYRKAQVLMFCTQDYETKATLDSANTYFGDPVHCLTSMEKSI